MAVNPDADYGRDILAVADADDLFSDGTGVDIVAIDVLHALTSDDFLGPGGDGRGFDIRQLVGSRQDELTSLQPILEEVAARDDRIDTVQVVLTSIVANGLINLKIDVKGTTAAGPFSITKLISQLSQDDIQNKVI